MDMVMNSGFFLSLLQEGGGSLIGLLLPWLLIFGIFYFLVIRPQQRKQKMAAMERDSLLNSLKPGDKVVTSGGILGTIVAVREDKVQLRIAQSVSIEILKSSIYGMQSEDIKEVEPAK